MKIQDCIDIDDKLRRGELEITPEQREQYDILMRRAPRVFKTLIRGRRISCGRRGSGGYYEPVDMGERLVNGETRRVAVQPKTEVWSVGVNRGEVSRYVLSINVPKIGVDLTEVTFFHSDNSRCLGVISFNPDPEYKATNKRLANLIEFGELLDETLAHATAAVDQAFKVE